MAVKLLIMVVNLGLEKEGDDNFLPIESESNWIKLKLKMN